MATDRCAVCRFPVGEHARKCGWCGTSVAHTTLVWPWRRNRANQVVAALPSDGPTRTYVIDALPLSHRLAATTLRERTFAVDPGECLSPSSPYFTQHAGGIPIGWTPPPPVAPLAPGVRWWIAVVLGMVPMSWFVAHGQSVWGEALAALGRVCWAGAMVLGIWTLTARSTRQGWRPWRGMITAALALTLVGCLMLAGQDLATRMQAQFAERAGQYNQALALYERAGTADDSGRVRLEWAASLAAHGDNIGAQAQIELALALPGEANQAAARAALGHLLWRWGKTLLETQHDPADARAKWEDAATRVADTPDGALAAQALAAPQSVTGRLTWLGNVPLPGMTVALISQWHYSTTLHYIQTSGERLLATTGDDGSFVIDGVKPGTHYALIWEGGPNGNQDYMATSPDGQPLYHVMVLPLVGADLGTIDIGQ